MLTTRFSWLAAKRSACVAATALLLLLASLAHCADTKHSTAAKADTTQGPTVVRPRITLIDEWTELPEGDSRNRVLLTGTLGLGAKRDYGLTIEIPLSQYRAGDNPGARSADGLGDIRTFLIHAVHVQGAFTHSWALESYFNTASKKPELGAGATTMLPSYALTYRPAKTAQFILLSQYQFDVRRDDGVRHTSQLAMRPFAVLNFPDFWYSFIELKGIVDFERDNRFALTGTASLGKFVGASRKWSLFGVVGGPLNGYAREAVEHSQFKLGMNYFF
jgi:hypothetical protein